MTNPQISASPDLAGGPARVNPEMPSTPSNMPNLDSQSVAGEEDPGASLSIPADSSLPPKRQLVPMAPGAIHPGDKAVMGTPGPAEGICRECGGSGRMANHPCPTCDATGKVTVGLGRA